MNHKEEIKKAEELFEAGRIDEAEDIFNLVLQHQPENYEILNNLGVIHHTRGNVEEAEAYFLKTLAIKQDYPDALLNLSLLYMNLKHWKQAAGQLEKYISIDSKNADVFNQLGVIYLEMGNKEASVSALAKSLEIDPNQQIVKDSLRALDQKENMAKQRPQNVSFPSPIVEIKVENKGTSYTVKLPQNESFLVKEIFHDNEYSIMNLRSHNGPMTIIDIGANTGLYAIYARFMDPNSIIHCFEPSPRCLVLLQANVGQIPGIHIHPIALSNREGEAVINLHRSNTAADSIRFRNSNYSESVRIQLRDAGKVLDELSLPHIDVLKIDTEGCEVEILESLGHRLSWIDYVLIEYHSEEDRRQVDHLLEEFHVFNSKSVLLGLGTVKYINSRLIN